jgi:3-hydroxyisobutyrate dehydrogenase and related beta-hydroxyacid dehydrogenases
MSTGTNTAATRIGFIGLGLMGHGIAKNLVAKGFR